jgi:membrane protein insertase Oxa1/YidC/SpoIIIJ
MNLRKGHVISHWLNKDNWKQLHVKTRYGTRKSGKQKHNPKSWKMPQSKDVETLDCHQKSLITHITNGNILNSESAPHNYGVVICCMYWQWTKFCLNPSLSPCPSVFSYIVSILLTLIGIRLEVKLIYGDQQNVTLG